ncbi:SMI1/KNR4 family protein [Photorhabdus stackebrandtii]|uniref:SMI1/KNR4 family protein n=1 Tax=Photorhabdus stackebrandtii TaxID=1123042 RepID=A0A7X5TMB1_9GAMM|nr:SMI1/KNR4 family protein [Photorhabdus stackebrandtii]NHB97548.1 hypothetical protein [Photorhabdus stackebrandtii]
MNRDKLIDLFSEHPDLLNMESADDAPSPEWTNKTEKALSLTLPDDYKWFLSNFGDGDICGDEIYSIYCMADSHNKCNIVNFFMRNIGK